jgi:hypothetical protein
MKRNFEALSKRKQVLFAQLKTRIGKLSNNRVQWCGKSGHPDLDPIRAEIRQIDDDMRFTRFSDDDGDGECSKENTPDSI